MSTESQETIYYDAIGKETIDPTFYDAQCQEVEKEPESTAIPNLEIYRLKYALQSQRDYGSGNDEVIVKKLLDHIRKNHMAPYYKLVCEELKMNIDNSFLKEMHEINVQHLTTLDEEIEYASKNLSTNDLKEAYLSKAKYLAKIGDKMDSLLALSQAYENTDALVSKLENLFFAIRLGLFFHDLVMIKDKLSKCKELIDDETADWHHRNCYRIYQGLYSLAIRDFSTSCNLFTSSIATFVCTEVISLALFMKYTVLSATLILHRRDLKKKILDNPEVLQALYLDPVLKKFTFSLYDGNYKEFFEILAHIERDMKKDPLLHSHSSFYIREMKIKAYDQLLSSYISLNLHSMAESFGVSEEYLENDITDFIARGRLRYKIDKTDGKIVNLKTDTMMETFEKVLKQGDILLNRVHKLSRVINV